MLKYRIEGHSTVSMDDALAQALAKAAAFASESHDMHIAVLELSILPGGGFRALVEVTIVPITFRDTLHRAAQDVELKRINDQDYRIRKHADDIHLKKEVEDHFLRIHGATPFIPDIHLAHLDNAQLMNNQIEKNFFDAYRAAPEPPPAADFETEVETVLGKQTHHHIQAAAPADHALAIDNPGLDDLIETGFYHAIHPLAQGTGPVIKPPASRPPHPAPGADGDS